MLSATTPCWEIGPVAAVKAFLPTSRAAVIGTVDFSTSAAGIPFSDGRSSATAEPDGTSMPPAPAGSYDPAGVIAFIRTCASLPPLGSIRNSLRPVLAPGRPGITTWVAGGDAGRHHAPAP